VGGNAWEPYRHCVIDVGLTVRMDVADWRSGMHHGPLRWVAKTLALPLDIDTL